MKTITLKQKFGRPVVVELYDSIKNLPAYRRNELHKNALFDMNVGTDWISIQAHEQANANLLGQLSRMVERKDSHDSMAVIVNKLLQESQNKMQNYWACLQKLDIKSHVFGVFIYSVNGSVCSLDKIESVITYLYDKGLTTEHVTDIVEEIKKNLTLN
jgi:hypothetical protein